MAYTKLSDTLNANEGEAYININGSNRVLFEISKLSAQLEFSVITKKMLGNRMKQHKINGIEGKGSLTMYFGNSDLLKKTLDYIKSGTYSGITLRVINADPQSTVGTGEVILSNVILSTIPAAYLEADSEDAITFDTDFTFDGIEGVRFFNLPTNQIN